MLSDIHVLFVISEEEIPVKKWRNVTYRRGVVFSNGENVKEIQISAIERNIPDKRW